jgi:hypothetical protein
MKESMDGKVSWRINENAECICCRDRIPKGHIFAVDSNFPKDPIDFLFNFKRNLPKDTKIRLTIETVDE